MNGLKFPLVILDGNASMVDTQRDLKDMAINLELTSGMDVMDAASRRRCLWMSSATATKRLWDLLLMLIIYIKSSSFCPTFLWLELVCACY